MVSEHCYGSLKHPDDVVVHLFETDGVAILVEQNKRDALLKNFVGHKREVMNIAPGAMLDVHASGIASPDARTNSRIGQFLRRALQGDRLRAPFAGFGRCASSRSTSLPAFLH